MRLAERIWAVMEDIGAFVRELGLAGADPATVADGLRNAHGIDVPHRIIEDVLALLPEGRF